MFYSDICQAFYITDENEGSDGKLIGVGLKDIDSQGAIAEFFFRLGCDEKHSETMNGYNISTYNKWFYGTTGAGNAWERFKGNFDDKEYARLLEKSFNADMLPQVAVKLGISVKKGKDVDGHRLAVAITRQLCEIYKSKKRPKQAESILNEVYYVGENKDAYTRYIEKAKERYNVMKLIGGEEVPLDKFFVCNAIGEKERVFADKNKITGEYLDKPTMQSIRDIFKRRGYDNLRTLLIGSGGCGKSLMLQHLFLQSAEEYTETGVLPIFLELRHFKQSDEILSFIVETVRSMDDSFNEEATVGLLLTGNCQLFLDGFDEIDPSDIGDFLTKFKTFSGKYDKVQIVVTSRQNESLTGFSQFMRLYIWPFENTRSELLINKILEYQKETDAKEAVLEYINNGFLKKDGIFASHPLLLTFVTMKYPSFHRFNEDPSLFYKVTFEALVSGHDDNKKPYDRVFMSVDNAEQFTIVFREFCALTYKDGVLQLNSRSFEEYFNQLKEHLKFENPHKMNVKNFKHDVCSTACIMYERDYDIFYIDPGFQECLFAEYYYHANEEEVAELTASLEKTSFTKLSRFEALDMLRKLATEKFDYKVLLPFLEEIFKNKDDKQSFRNFLQCCFDAVKVVSIKDNIRLSYMEKLGVTKVLYPMEENYSKTVLLNYIMKDMGENPEYDFCLYAKDDAVDGKKVISLDIPEDAEISGVVIAQEIQKDNDKCLLIDCKPMEAYTHFRSEHLKGNQDAYLVDDKNDLVLFGNRITLEGYYLQSEPDEFDVLLENIAANSQNTYSMFLRLKEYCKKLRVESFKHR